MPDYTYTIENIDLLRSRIAFYDDHVDDLLQQLKTAPRVFKQDYYKTYYDWVFRLGQLRDNLANLEQIEARK